MSEEGRLVAGRYRLTERIGRGGMGTVWRADDEVLDRQVALKQIHARPQLSDDELATLYERTRREARSAARVVHPNVVVVHDVVEDGGRPCIVMEYVPATTLADLLDGGRTLVPEEAARIGLGMVAALRAAHAAGVLHRDVKPGNVLLGPDDRVVLTDFGIALTAGSSTLTQTGQMVGSIPYMAPERLRGLTPGPASDLWSLGATLYQAVEGRPPFRRETAMETAYAIVTDPVEPMKQAGPLEPLVRLLLSKDPADRPSAEQAERALLATWSGAVTELVLPTEPVRAPAPPAAPGARRRRRGRRGRLALVAGAVALAAAAGTAVTLLHTPARRTPTSTPASSPLPGGYHRVTDKSLGVSFPVPDDWTVGTRATDESSTRTRPAWPVSPSERWTRPVRTRSRTSPTSRPTPRSTTRPTAGCGCSGPTSGGSPPRSGSSPSRAGPAPSAPSTWATAGRAAGNTTSTSPRRGPRGRPTGRSSTT